MSAGDWKDMLSAIQDGDIDIVKYHVENGINPNYQHPEFLTTPLIASIEHDRIEIAKYLLENGANPKLKAGFSSDTPLAVAKKQKNKEMIRLIKFYLPQKRFSIFSKWR